MRNLFGCFGRRSSSSRVFCSRGRRETNTIERSRKARAKSLPLFREESCRCSRRRRRYHYHHHHHRSCNRRRRRGRSRVLLRTTWYHGTIFTTFSTQKFTCVCVLSRSRVHVHLYAFTVSEREIILLLLEHAVQAENLLQTCLLYTSPSPRDRG